MSTPGTPSTPSTPFSSASSANAPRIAALRYVAVPPRGYWQVRMTTGEIQECTNLRAFSEVPGIFERAVHAQKHPGTWVTKNESPAAAADEDLPPTPG